MYCRILTAFSAWYLAGMWAVRDSLPSTVVYSPFCLSGTGFCSPFCTVILNYLISKNGLCTTYNRAVAKVLFVPFMRNFCLSGSRLSKMDCSTKLNFRTLRFPLRLKKTNYVDNLGGLLTAAIDRRSCSDDCGETDEGFPVGGKRYF